MDAKLEKILENVDKPSRYVGGEFCLPVIDDQTRIRCCLCVPKLYEVGMKNISALVPYYMLNDRKGYSCERCFAPWLDMGKQLKANKYPLYSLETKKPLKKFDLLNFYFDYTYSYTTFLYMLDLAQIPYKSKDRGEEYPLIYGSGICMSNPEPLADFLDFAIIGDQEDVTIKVIDCLIKTKLSKFNKTQTLDALSKIDGVYVPSKINFTYDKNGKIKRVSGESVNWQIVKDLDRAYYPISIIVPNECADFEGGVLEAVRGCTKGCRFCQEGYLNRPLRERRVQTLVSQANGQAYNSGVSTISLGSLSSDGYSKTSELLNSLNKLCEDKNVKVLMKSFRADSLNINKSNFKNQDYFNFSIEAATERLRNIINKNLSDSEFEQSFISAFESGFNKVKLNFMIGLPYETTEDIVAIVDLVKKIKDIYSENKITEQELSIFVNVSIFVPKPFTAFQWCGFIGKEEARKRIKFLTLSLKNLGVETYFYSPEISEIETILSRGDRKISNALLYAYLYGSIFDNNDLLFDVDVYNDAFAKLEINKQLYLSKKELSEVLPWDKIKIGVSNEYLEDQFKIASKGVCINDCKHSCNHCGLQDKGICKNGHN